MDHCTLLASFSQDNTISIGHLFREYASDPGALRYEPSTHRVLLEDHFHTEEKSGWGYQVISIPDSVGTVGALAAWLAQSQTFTPLPELRLFWVEQQQSLVFYKEKVTVGRFPHQDLRFADTHWFPKLSRRHCIFIHQNQQWYLMDLGSANHTWLNQFPLKSELPVALHAGDGISFCRNGDTFLFDPPRI